MRKRFSLFGRIHLSFLLFACFNCVNLVAQPGADAATEVLFAKYAIENSNKQHQPYYVCVNPPGNDAAIKVVRSLSEKVIIVKIINVIELDALSKNTRVAPANNEWKFSPSMERLLNERKNTTGKYIISGESTVALVIALKNLKGVVVLSSDESAHSVIIRCNSNVLRQIVELKEVQFIDVFVTAHVETNIIGYDRSFHGINAVDYLLPGANGKNIVAGVKEQKMDENDPDLWKRVLPSPIAATTTSYHATVIASIIGGAGNSSYEGRGIAWGCKFFSSSFSNLFADDAAVLSNNKVTVQNHSYGTVIQQYYGAEAVSYDQLSWNNKVIVPVMSSGNQGTSAASEGQYANIPGFANLTGNFKMAKNIITIGAIDNKNNIPSLSSAGPLYDGRLAPQLIALGPNGTSDATAIVTGTIAVMQQVYADSNNNDLPDASLIKAVLFNTADDVYNPGIDYKTGYGILNSYAAIKAIQQKHFDGGAVSQGQQWTKTINVPANAASLKLTLVWTDPAATVNNNKALINDLDLVVTEVNSGVEYKPWVLSTAANKDSLAKEPLRKRDSLNTAEQVSINLPAQGNFEVKVTGNTVPNASIPFHIAYRIDTLNTFQFTNPLHASDIHPQKSEPLVIKWKTHVADTNQTGDLYISYDAGTNWQLIRQSVKLHLNQYSWERKDTSAAAILRMSTSFGDFISNRFIISDPLALQVDFNCADSFRLSWRPHVYANAYKLYNLADSPYLKHVLTISDTFVVLNRSAYPILFFAAEPVLNNNLNAARSQLINIDLQGVDCFYRALNYILLDTNRLQLSLELSALSYIDSVYFERVTASGTLLEVYGGTKVLSGVSIYQQYVPELFSGTTWLRARIKLKNGAIVFTEIISVTTTGKKKVLFYPNPVSRGAGANYILEQGLSSDAMLLLYDMTGRLVRSVYAGESIKASSLSPGMYIYKLVDENKSVLETGKLLLQ